MFDVELLITRKSDKKKWQGNILGIFDSGYLDPFPRAEFTKEDVAICAILGKDRKGFSVKVLGAAFREGKQWYDFTTADNVSEFDNILFKDKYIALTKFDDEWEP